MIKNKEQRVGVFVDGANMYYAARHHGGRLNFKELLKAAVAGRKLIRAISYVIKSDAPEEKTFFDALDKLGYEVKFKDLQIFLGGKKKADWDVGIAMDMVKMAEALDVLVLVSGDGDYLPVVEYLQNHGKLVEVISFADNTSSRLSEKADEFQDLAKEEGRFVIKG